MSSRQENRLRQLFCFKSEALCVWLLVPRAHICCCNTRTVPVVVVQQRVVSGMRGLLHLCLFASHKDTTTITAHQVAVCRQTLVKSAVRASALSNLTTQV